VVSKIEEATIIIGSQMLTRAQSMAVRVGMTTFLHLMEKAKAMGDNEVGEQLRTNYRDAAAEVLRMIAKSRRGGG
jgi:hypothetical protein